jgi:hypothetical protein
MEVMAVPGLHAMGLLRRAVPLVKLKYFLQDNDARTIPPASVLASTHFPTYPKPVNKHFSLASSS